MPSSDEMKLKLVVHANSARDPHPKLPCKSVLWHLQATCPWFRMWNMSEKVAARDWLLDLIYKENLHRSGITFSLPLLWAEKWIVLDNSGLVSRTASDKLRHNWPSAEPQFLPVHLLLNPPQQQEKHGQQVEGRDSAPLVCSWWEPTWSPATSSGSLSTGETWTCWSRSRGGCKNDQRAGTPLLGGKAERVGAAQPGEDCGTPYSSLQVQKGGLQKRWGQDF